MRWCVVTAGLAALLLQACGGQNSTEAREKQMEEYAAKHGVAVDVELDERGGTKSVAINTPTGGQVGTNLKLPDGFPADVAVHPDEAIMSAVPTPGGFMVQALTKGDAIELLAWHRAGLIAQGWSEEDAGPSAGGMQRASFKKDGRVAAVNFIPNGDGFAVQIVTMTLP